MIICGQGTERKIRTEQPSLENSRVVELTFLKNVEALYHIAGQIKELNARYYIDVINAGGILRAAKGVL